MAIFLSPPILIDLGLAVLLSALLKRAAWRAAAWFVVPLLVAFCFADPCNLFWEVGEGHGYEGIIFMYLSAFGLVASTAGTLLGYVLRRFAFSQRKAPPAKLCQPSAKTW
jgi:hypothetical protein